MTVIIFAAKKFLYFQSILICNIKKKYYEEQSAEACFGHESDDFYLDCNIFARPCIEMLYIDIILI